MQKVMDKTKGVCRAWWKKALICLILAVAISFGLEWLQLATQPKQYTTEELGVSEESFLSLENANLIECSMEGVAVRVDGGPAELQFFLDGDTAFNRISVYFDEPPVDSGVMRVLYAPAGQECSVEQSTQLPFDPGMEKVDFTFQEGSYDKIKVQVAGNAIIQSVSYAMADYRIIAIKENISGKRIALLSVGLFAVFMILFGIHGWTRLCGTLKNAKNGICGDWKKTLIRLGLFVGTAALMYIFLRLYVPYFLNKPFNWVLRFFCLTVSAASGCLFCFRKTLGTKPEVFFLILCLLIGVTFSVFEAATTTNSWDDGHHYMSASKYSYLGQTRLTEQDNTALAAWSERVYDLSAVDDWHARQDQVQSKGVVTLSNGSVNPKEFWMLFSGIGLYVGRVLGLSYHGIWEMGRLFSLIAYAVIGYFAIRRLKSGKMILAAVLLIPECIFLAANYSYDPGVVAFLALGLSYCFAEWQEPDKKLTGANAFIMLAALFLGCWTKGIYFPVFFIPMFLPVNKFKSKVWRRVFIGIAAALILYLVWDFAHPYLGGQASQNTDNRIYTDADAGKQIAFILANPLYYTGVLLRGLRSVLGPENSEGLFTFFAYMGKAPNNFIYVIILAILAFTDKSTDDHELARRGWMRLFFEFLMFGIACLAATSMYIAFTPVGADRIEGFQFRYTLPIIYPAIMLLGSGKIQNNINRTVYNGLIYAAIGFVGFSAVLINVAALYS